MLSFLIWNFAIEFMSFSRGEEFNNGFLMSGITRFDCCLILFARKKFHRKKAKEGKNVV